MKTLLRIFISLLMTLWLGAVMFFPAVAAISFKLLPDKQMAGLIVRNCLIALHYEGLTAGTLLLILLVLAAFRNAYGRPLIGPVLCTIAMLLLTAFSQWHIIPRMEMDRAAVGGDIDKAAPHDPYRVNFNQLHNASEDVEEGVHVAGVAMVVFLARPALRQD